MTDYSKFKVPELKDELKSRGEPLTGLKLKQQFIDRLVELDARKDEEGVQDVVGEVDDNKGADAEQEVSATGPESQHKEETVEEVPRAQDEEKKDVAMTESGGSGDVVQDGGGATTGSGSQPNTVSPSQDNTQESAAQDDRPIVPPLDTNTMAAEQAPSDGQEIVEPDVLEDQRKRKRRSVTPVPLSAEVSLKKARASNGSPRPTKVEGGAVNDISENSAIGTETNGHTETKEAITEQDHIAPSRPHENGDRVRARDQKTSEHKHDDHHEASAPTSRSAPPLYKELTPQDARHTPPPAQEEDDRDDQPNQPALHPATSSLYIRNLKRPLQISTLRTHIKKLASPPNTPSDPSLITEVFLDSIKSHAFVSFSSITTASRVRSKLNNVIWPAEPMRDPLFVDFIPDEKVRQWIDTESSGGGSRGYKKWEVVYSNQDSEDGSISATLQEVGANPPPSFLKPTTTNIPPPTRPHTITAHQPHSDSSAPPVHPSRAALIPPTGLSQKHPKSQPHPPQPSNQPPPSKAFKSLSQLFPSTSTKPLLYYKPVPQSVADSRLRKFRSLYRVERVAEGEEMRRFSFEKEDENGKGVEEEWVDKGPEFGYRSSQPHQGPSGPRGARGGGRGSGTSYRGRGRGGRSRGFYDGVGFRSDAFVGRGGGSGSGSGSGRW